MNSNDYTGLEIAVIGMSFRTSEATTWREFWQNLVGSKESLKFFTDEELLKLGTDQSFMDNENYVNSSPSIIDKNCFDSNFFGYTPDEAKFMYPGHRFFHECVWEAIEDAGYNIDECKDSIGIYGGAGNDLIWKTFVNLVNENHSVDGFFLEKISNKDYLTSLISYKLGLTGPSVTLNTACSTSLVAIHMACKALIFGEAKIAVAGASSINSVTEKGYLYEEGSILSNDGHCKAFDENSTGTVEGEGTGVVVLKRLQAAIDEGDHIYGIIKGSAVNNDGNQKMGYTAPSVIGQVACIKKAQKFSKVEPHTIGYVETHGTATKLGDSIEIESLNQAFNTKDISCPIGSVKTNIGHLDTASGVAGFIKTVLSLHNKTIPASLHFNKPDPLINFSEGPFYVNNKLAEWTENALFPRRAAINSFGVGGTNAHLILEQAPAKKIIDSENDINLLVLSAKTKESLNNYLLKLSDFLNEENEISLSDMCHTFQIGRKKFDNRVSISFQDKPELIQKINGLLQKPKTTLSQNIENTNVVFAFPGQGSQYVNIGKDVYNSIPRIKEILDEGFELLFKMTNINFHSIIYPSDNEREYNINDTEYAQPLIFLIEYASAQFLIESGVVPNQMIGHSIGEYVAATIAGVFTFEEALKVVVERGRIMNSLEKGSMLSVAIGENQAENYVNSDISLAAINGPQQIVFSGNDSAIEKLADELTNDEVPFVKLHTSHAFHSSMQDGILEEFKEVFKDIKFKNISIPFISNVTGELVQDSEVSNADYWARQLRSTVNFSKGVKNLIATKKVLFIEVGGGNSLSNLIKQHTSNKAFTTFNLIGNAKNTENGEKYLFQNLGGLWCQGVNLDWSAIFDTSNRNRISLPTYAFDKTKYVAEVDIVKMIQGIRPSLFESLENSFYFPSWKKSNLENAAKTERKSFLFFVDETHFSKNISSELVKLDHSIIEVNVGTEFIKNSSSNYTIDPLSKEDYNQLFNELQKDSIEINEVVYGWGMNVSDSKLHINENNLEFNLSYSGLVNLINSWEQEETKNLYLLTNSLHSVLGNEKLNYSQSLMLGLMKIIRQEKLISCINIDVILEEKSEKLIQKCVSEILSNDMKLEDVISFRFGQRGSREFQKKSQNINVVSEIKQDGTYLITGGLGNLGYSFANYLITKYNATIILNGRTKQEDLNELSLKRFNALRALNDKTFYIDADVVEIEALREKIELHQDSLKDLNGIIHLAGNVNEDDVEFLENSTFEKTSKMLSPKLIGIENIKNVFDDKKLDFVWMSSSLAATLGGYGFGAYAAANSYLDYFAFAHMNEFKCVEMPYVDFESDVAIKNKNALSIGEVLEIFERSLSLKSENVIYISKEDMNADPIAVDEANEEEEIIETGEKVERPSLTTEFISAESETELALSQVFTEFFRINDIGIQDEFYELGGDSLKAMVLIKKINQQFELRISISDFLMNNTIQKLASLIDEKKWLTSNVEFKNEIII
jgi:acyl transferase domain-containing protein